MSATPHPPATPVSSVVVPAAVPAPSAAADRAESRSAWAPFAYPAFRIIWSASMTAALCTWMNDVAAAWLMTSMTTDPLMVALVQSAATLPMFLLGLPAGTVADTSDRRQFLIATQVWITAIALLSCLVLWSGLLNPPLLLILSFASGIGLALRFPGIAGALPETLPRSQLAQGLALNSVALNVARTAGPAVAGALIAALGSGAVYLTNAVISLAGFAAVLRWQGVATPPPAVRPPLWPALVDGARRALAIPAMRRILLSTLLFYGHVTILVALLPLVARRLDPHSPTMFALLFGALGAGAVFVCIFILPRLRGTVPPESRVRGGALLIAAMIVLVAFSPWAWLSTGAMFVAGIAWTAVGNTLTVQAQLTVPAEIRSRGMSLYHATMMGAMAGGASLWGMVAGHIGIPATYALAAASAALAGVLSYRPDALGGLRSH